MNLNNYTVLAVNDAPDQLELLAFILNGAGYRVLTADNGSKGLKIARQELPDLIISDVMMPEMNGIEFCREIRADKELNLTPFLLVSALCKDAESTVEGFEAGADDYIESPFEPMRLVAKSARLIERKSMDDTLRESENRFRMMIENVTDILSILSPEGKVIYESPSLENILGYKPEELTGKSAFDFIHSEDKNRVIEYFNLAIRNFEETKSIEYRFRHKNNLWRTMESVGKPFIDPTKGLVAIVTSRDITERKQAESDLRESQERYRNFIEQSTEGIWRIEFKKLISINLTVEKLIKLASQHGYFAECNDTMARMYGFNSADDLIGKKLIELMLFSESINQEFIRAFIENGFRLTDAESHELDAQGENKYFLNNLVGIIEDGNISCIWGIQRDITGQKMADIALRASEERFRTQYKGIPIPTATWKRIEDNFVLVDFNDAAAEITQGKLADFLGANAESLYADTPEIIEDFNRCFNEKSVVRRETNFKFRTTGEEKRVIITCVFVSPDILMVHYRDITAQVKTEESLRKSEERFQMASRATNDAFWDWDLITDKVWYSESYYKLMGNSPDEVESDINLWRKAIHPDDREKVISKNQEVIEKGENTWTDEYRLRSTDGTDAYIFDRGYVVYDADGTPVRMIGAAINITERKLAEQVLRTNQERLQKQNEVLNELTKHHNFFHIPLQTAIREITEIAAQILETERVSVWLYKNRKSKIQAIDLYELTPNCHSEGLELAKLDYPEYFKALAKDMGIAAHDAHTDSRTREFSESYLKPLGITSMLDTPIRLGGKVVGVVCHEHIGIAREWKLDEQNFAGSMAALVSLLLEANERRQAEDSLRESQKNLIFQAHLLDTVEQAVIATDLSGTITYWNRFAHQLYGWTAAEAVGQNIMELTTPKIEHEQAIEIMSGLRIGKSWSGEFFVMNKNGTIFPAQVFNSPVNDSEGNLIGIVGISFDISNQKQAEEALSRSENHLRAIVDTEPECVKLIGLKGELLEMNPAGLAMIEADSFEQVKGADVVSIVAPEYREAYTELRNRVLRGESGMLSFEIIGLKGTRLWLETHAVPLRNQSGEITSLLAVTSDVTGRKKAENELAEANERAIREYDRLLQRLSTLAQKSGGARDLATIFSSLLDFARSSFPCSALFISLYDEDKGVRRGIYLWYNGKEMDVANIEPIPVGEGYAGQSIKSGEVKINNDYLKTFSNKPTNVYIGFDVDERQPRSAIIAPMKMMGKVIGAIEVQSYELGAYCEEHITAMRMAANVAANAIENVRLLEQERQNAEQLKQSQKLESVGRLAGGIAHDFNNMLTAINGYSDLTLRRLDADSPLRKNIEEIKKAGERSAALTHQLLAFSRRQVLKPKVLNLNEVVIDTNKMLQRLIGEDIQFNIIPNSKLGLIEADPGQLTQVIMNLVINARDAMPQGGNLTIETDNVYLDKEYAENHIPTRIGAYILLAVSDTGVGINAEIRQHIFEPFFTTKETGKGTGLGLATVYGIIKQSGGYIWVYSELGKGTTFKVYLPRVDEKVESFEENEESAIVISGTETILLVEDEEMVRNLSRQVLETCGYKVIEARNGIEALVICESQNPKIDLLMTDVVMPQMGGRELAEKLMLIYPHVRLLYTSGYTDDAIIRQGIITEDMNFIQKPFTFEGLTKKIRELLDAKAE